MLKYKIRENSEFCQCRAGWNLVLVLWMCPLILSGFKVSLLNIVLLFRVQVEWRTFRLGIGWPYPAMWPWKTHFLMDSHLWEEGSGAEGGGAGVGTTGTWTTSPCNLLVSSGPAQPVLCTPPPFDDGVLLCLPSFIAWWIRPLWEKQACSWRTVKAFSDYIRLWVFSLDNQIEKEDFYKTTWF